MRCRRNHPPPPRRLTPSPVTCKRRAASTSCALCHCLAALFGPFGLFYSSLLGLIVMLVLSAGGSVVAFGLALFVLWPVWAVVVAQRHDVRVTPPRVPAR